MYPQIPLPDREDCRQCENKNIYSRETGEGNEGRILYATASIPVTTDVDLNLSQGVAAGGGRRDAMAAKSLLMRSWSSRSRRIMAVVLRLVVGVVATAPVSPWTLMVFLSLEAPDEGVSHGGSLSTCSSCCSTCSPTELIAAARGFLKV